MTPPSTPPALIMAGMHRSGTSLTAAILGSAGLDIGRRLLGADADNARGHFEDVDFLLLHQRILTANGLSPDGFIDSGDPAVPAPLRSEAQDLADSRRAGGVPWGWKEPRTVLFLDFWERLLPEARFLFVFRRPWEVLDSLFRRGNTEFVENPRLALEVWCHYNSRILDVARRSPEKCLVVESTQVVADPAAIVAAVRTRLSMPIGFPSPQYEAGLFHEEHGSWRPWLVRQLCPRAYDLYLTLRALADSRSRLPALTDEPASLATALEAALAEWSRAGRGEGSRG